MHKILKVLIIVSIVGVVGRTWFGKPALIMAQDRRAIVQYPRNTASIAVMSFNVRRKGKDKPQHQWNKRIPHIKQMLASYSPDIIGFQEPIKEQVNNLASALPAYTWVGQGRKSAWAGLSKNEYTPIFYLKNKFRLLKHETFFINSAKTAPWKWQKHGNVSRVCTSALFEDLATHQKFYVYNLHLDNKYPIVRQRGLKKILHHIACHTDPALPVIIMGDFNSDLAGNLALQLQHAHFVPMRGIASQIRGPRETANDWGKRPARLIDHMLINKTGATVFDVATYQVIKEENNIYLSDHRPVFVELTTKKRSS